MSHISDNDSDTSSDSENSMEKVPVSRVKKVKEAWKPDEEPETKPKRKYIRKAKTEEEAMAIKQKKIENLAKARAVKQQKNKKPEPSKNGGVRGEIPPPEPEPKPEKKSSKKVVKQYITNNYISEKPIENPEKSNEKGRPKEKQQRPAPLNVRPFNFV
jgi:hypothetical protein